ncbi:MAG: hypothetical protein L3J57_03650 [Desulfuromusa sp.]|nr:hypothetical protein [Desulfuromusa sp.]
MPGKHITQRQEILYMQSRQSGLTQETSAAKAGVSKSLKEPVSDQDGWGNLTLRVQETLSHPENGYDANALKIKWRIKPGEK